MIKIETLNNVVAVDALLKAQKAADRYAYQFDLCLSIMEGTCRKFHSTFEEEFATLKKRQRWAKNKILELNRVTKVLERKYDLSKESEVRAMIYDFAIMVDKFVYQTELQILEA